MKSPAMPKWADIQSMYAGAYLVSRAVDDFVSGIIEAHARDGSPESMDAFVRGAVSVRDDAFSECSTIAKQVDPQKQQEAREEMDRLIKYRKTL